MRLFVLCALALLLGGCATVNLQTLRNPFASLHPASPQARPPLSIPGLKPAPRRIWTEGVAGAPSIRIEIGEQRALFFKGQRLVGETDISSGRDGYDTPPGTYRVIQKDKDHRSNLYGDFVNSAGEVVKANADLTKQTAPPGTTFLGAQMPYFLRFRGGYGLHAGRLPGRRASHGCVRLPLVMARHYYENASLGTPVIVRP